MIIYKIINLINKKIYVGQDTRNNPNYYGSGKLIIYAIKKYGKKNFKKEIVEDGINNIDLLNEREVYWIKKLNSKRPNGYNLTDGGFGHLGYEYTEEHRKNLSDAMLTSKKFKEVMSSPEYRKKISDTKKSQKRKHSVKTRKLISEKRKLFNTPE